MKQVFLKLVDTSGNYVYTHCRLQQFRINTMADLLSIPNDKQGTFESIRDDPPTHFTFAIQSFSLLAKCSIERYETSIFEAGGYKWKLCVYPNGNKTKNVKEHVSLYLAIADTKSLPRGWSVNVVSRLFLFDQIHDKYLVIEDAKATGLRFHAMKTEWGFDQFIALKTFNEPSNGYIIDDECVFGAEVFICNEKPRGNGERLSMIKAATTIKNTWKVENYTKLSTKDCIESDPFIAGDQKWLVRLYPNGFGDGKGSSVSLYLVLADSDAIPASRNVYVDFTLRFMNQSNQRVIQSKGNYWFSASKNLSGWPKFLQHNYVSLLKDVFTVEAEVTVMGVAENLS